MAVSRASLLAHPERCPTAGQLAEFQSLVRRRASNFPLPYVIGRVEFYGLEFEVTPEVLIPRPETETLVDLALARRAGSVVDVGTGSGCVAISLAVHLPESDVCAIEISPAALAVAQRNVERHSVTRRVQLMVGDVLNPRPSPVDLIVSNPPYIPTGECASLPESVRDYEPRLALDGGPDGLAIVQQLLAQAPAVLNPGGGILIEIGADQGEAAAYIARTTFPKASIQIHPDLAGRDRVLEIQT
jgi:release factor glutamine methyltransferase